LVVVGETVLEIVVVKAASLNQVSVPSEQFPESVLDSPEQIADGLAVKAIGTDGMVVTLTFTESFTLVQIPFTQAA
jgi:threonine dehydratase